MNTRALVTILSTIAAASSHVIAQTTTRVSVSTGAVESDAASGWPSISDDGMTVVFTTSATTLASGDPTHQDVYMHDLGSGVTTRLSVPIGATTGNSYFPSISANGDLVVFESIASNLVTSDANGSGSDVFLYDRGTNALSVVSVNTAGNQGTLSSGFGDISPEGRFVAFSSDCTNFDTASPDTNHTTDVFLRDRTALTTQRISVRTVGTTRIEADGGSEWPSVSANGDFVAFGSYATNLTAAADTNGKTDVFLWDSSGGIVLVSHSFGGAESNGTSSLPSISADGRYVVFWSLASNLMPTSIPDGNGGPDVFVWDRVTDTIDLVSINSAGTAAGNSLSNGGSISRDGSFISFASYASDLISGDNNSLDVFLYDRVNRTTERVSLATPYLEATANSTSSFKHSVSAYGARTVFISQDASLDPSSPDSNGVDDIFVRDRCGRPITFPFCPPGTSTNGCQATLSVSGMPSASATSGFTITATNVEGNHTGFIFYSPLPTYLPFGPTSHLCVGAPSKGKSAAMSSGGNNGMCNGSISLDWNAFNTNHPWSFGQYPLGFTVGATIYAQCWYRDPPSFPKHAQLSNAVEFGLCP